VKTSPLRAAPPVGRGLRGRAYTEGVEHGADVWAELVELYEYKVADMMEGREPRGGRRSVVGLREALMHGDLDATLIRRFRRADKLWRQHSVRATPSPTATPAYDPSTLGDWSLQSDAPRDVEGQTLSELATDVWRLRASDQLQKLAASWRREPGLTTLRALYGLSLNLEAGKLQHDVPSENDPLVSVSNPEVAHGILNSLLDQLLAFKSDTLTPVAWARPMMLELANNPFPSTRRSSVESAVGGTLSGGARTGERTQIREALARGFEAITQLLPQQLGGTGEDVPTLKRALFAKQPERRLTQPDAGSLLAIRLAGAGSVQWHGHTIAWHPEQGSWALVAAGATYALRRDESGSTVTRVPLEGIELRALLRGEYLLLSVEEGGHASLGTLLAVARPIAALLEGADDYLHLRLARGVAQFLRDARFDAQSVSPQSAAKYAVVPPDTLFAFARKGAENLLARVARRSDADVKRAFREVGRALGCAEDRALRLLDLLRATQTGGEAREVEGHVSGNDEVAVIAYQGEPVTVRVQDRVLTLRADYRGEVTAVLPGVPAAPVRDVWVIGVQSGSVLIARQGLRIAVGYQTSIVGH